ncbi:hypothetical protein [Beijerinckia sp. L45]|uniref:hypothetical protein n=1 Tax=Beijerinckia sp. L45 TaxID=1641855 RepID=UPI00131D7F32|nr:hypothetical protein [Beijerinckia sp. L45]
MMPVSHRVAAAFGAAAKPAGPQRVRATNSGTVVIAVATTFALLSALMSLLPDTAPPSDDLAQTRLRGSLPAVVDPAAP